MDRRDFLQSSFALGALAGVEPTALAHALFPEPDRLSWRANRTAGREGAWRLTEIEGEVPDGLSGTLYRVAPGQSENHGVTLTHLFDGDAFALGFSFRAAGDRGSAHVDFRARFIETDERRAETAAGRMLYAEVGTLAPPAEPDDPPLFPFPMPPGTRLKNQPSVNVIHWDGRLLGLSEGGVPTAFDPGTFAFEERWTFRDTLPPFFQGFTAHPRFDPATGVGYAWGIQYGLDLRAVLVVWRMELDGQLRVLHRLPLDATRMVHDVLLTERHLVFLIPPVTVDLAAVMQGGSTIMEAFRTAAEEPTEALVLDREPGGPVRRLELPPSLVFHHGNAWEQDGQIVLDTYLAADDSILRTIAAWSEDRLPPFAPPVETRVVLAPESGGVTVVPGAPRREFPRFDLRRAGLPTSLRYTVEQAEGDEDPFRAGRLVVSDERAGREVAVDAGAGRMYGEPVHVPRDGSEDEADGFVLALGYDGARDRTFVEVRAAEDLGFLARVWAPDHYPLGFHGNFVPDVFVAVGS